MHGRLENIVGSGENAGYQYFLLFSQGFQKLSYLQVLKVGIVWCRVKPPKLLRWKPRKTRRGFVAWNYGESGLKHHSVFVIWEWNNYLTDSKTLTLYQTSPELLLLVRSTSLLKTLGKGEIVRNKQFLLFPQCFLPVCRTFYHFHQIENCHQQSLSVLKSLKLVIWESVKGGSNAVSGQNNVNLLFLPISVTLIGQEFKYQWIIIAMVKCLVSMHY